MSGRGAGRPVTVWVDGQPHLVAAGQTVASALMARGPEVRWEPGGGSARGIFCGMGSCQDCRVMVDGRVALSCLAPVADGQRIETTIGGGAHDDAR